MAAVLIRKMIVFVMNPLLHLSHCTAIPHHVALSTFLLGSPGAAVQVGAKLNAAVVSLLSYCFLPCLQSALGFKTKGTIKKRCRDCDPVKRCRQWFIHCKMNPKHKHRQM
ncbi:LOW QUALITY PROTEIN: 39S ribosomal protein L36, mitochondrial [Rousettus aegyptiacus]|uniref:LOW QUALITY PROTEIN: 39S ribosomal protein L36, mitochondrial n=1 Tax=Rousettus aegyptiacus TaxID=9407 RepID=UPI00168CF342|nr:LOW QUALITY PROTEIN: 39S ribosomal protein L36, mitochondrial [Rousettus aegyptiacus]